MFNPVSSFYSFNPVINDLEYFRYHLKIHTGEKPFPCSKCGRSFRVKPMLNLHIQVNIISSLIKCPTSDWGLLTYSILIYSVLMGVEHSSACIVHADSCQPVLVKDTTPNIIPMKSCDQNSKSKSTRKCTPIQF
jgi:uncharacterized Zn-finger protein